MPAKEGTTNEWGGGHGLAWSETEVAALVKLASGLHKEVGTVSKDLGLDGLTSIAIDYPSREYRVAGWNIGWVGVYLALTLAFAWVLKGAFGVTM